MVRKEELETKVMRLGKYELGRTLGEGNFGKVKLARNSETGQYFAVKILEKKKIIDLKITDQIKREIGTLKLLKHPNVVRLHEVLASKTKIYMVLEYVNGGELFDRIGDGLLHTTCGSPNYVAPEVLSNRGYDGATSDIWSCGVILYVILTGYLPFDDRNLAVLYQKIFKGDAQIPKWLSPGAQNLIKRILDPNPATRITMAGIKADEWFNQDYIPANPDDEEDIHIDDEAFSMHEVPSDTENSPSSPALINAFQLIGMSSCLDLSGFFEKEDVSERKIRFTSNHSAKDLLERIEDIVKEMGFSVLKKNGRLKVVQEHRGQRSVGSLSVAAEVFEISPSLYVVELRKSYGDSSVYRQLCKKLSNDLGVGPTSQELLGTEV
ncbi:CBL-interacting protein kinase 1 [Morella rubra]|uniref:non-specific serine/threonine protein kinase n=1 Tax=Morella rubra TaxID=262757 RepID=A0A6A1VLH8_9ROSI|nr:CBL-interacting protein kinase 1 [Morella rubra]